MRALSSFRFYDLLISYIFVVILLISNLVGQKICVILHPRFCSGAYVSGAQLLFPLSYIFTDVFTEAMATVPLGRRFGWPFFRIEGIDVFERGTNFNPFARTQKVHTVAEAA